MPRLFLQLFEIGAGVGESGDEFVSHLKLTAPVLNLIELDLVVGLVDAEPEVN